MNEYDRNAAINSMSSANPNTGSTSEPSGFASGAAYCQPRTTVGDSDSSMNMKSNDSEGNSAEKHKYSEDCKEPIAVKAGEIEDDSRVVLNNIICEDEQKKNTNNSAGEPVGIPCTKSVDPATKEAQVAQDCESSGGTMKDEGFDKGESSNKDHLSTGSYEIIILNTNHNEYNRWKLIKVNNPPLVPLLNGIIFYALLQLVSYFIVVL